MYAACVKVGSRDRPRRVDGAGAGICSARDIERGEGAVGSPQEAVNHAACVCVVSRDRARRVDAEGEGGYGARGIKRGEGTDVRYHERRE